MFSLSGNQILAIENETYIIDGNLYDNFTISDSATLRIENSTFVLINKVIPFIALDNAKIIIINSNVSTTLYPASAIPTAVDTSWNFRDNASLTMINSTFSSQISNAWGSSNVYVKDSYLRSSLFVSSESNASVVNSRLGSFRIGRVGFGITDAVAYAYLENCTIWDLDIIYPDRNLENLQPGFYEHLSYPIEGGDIDVLYPSYKVGFDVYNSTIEGFSAGVWYGQLGPINVSNCSFRNFHVDDVAITFSNSIIGYLDIGHSNNEVTEVILTNGTYANKIDTYAFASIDFSEDSSFTEIDVDNENLLVSRDFFFYFDDINHTTLDSITNVQLTLNRFGSFQDKQIEITRTDSSKFSAFFYFDNQNISRLNQPCTITFAYNNQESIVSSSLGESSAFLFLDLICSTTQIEGTGWYKKDSIVQIHVPQISNQSGGTTADDLFSYSIDGSEHFFGYFDSPGIIDVLMDSPRQINITYGIRENQRPIAILSVDPTTINTDQEVLCNAMDSYDPDGQIILYRFDFGDGTNTGWITSSTVSHTYLNAGNYTINLIVQDNGGDTSNSDSTLSVTITVIPEFSSWIILPMFLIITIIVAIYRRKLTKHS